MITSCVNASEPESAEIERAVQAERAHWAAIAALDVSRNDG